MHTLDPTEPASIWKAVPGLRRTIESESKVHQDAVHAIGGPRAGSRTSSPVGPTAVKPPPGMTVWCTPHKEWRQKRITFALMDQSYHRWPLSGKSRQCTSRPRDSAAELGPDALPRALQGRYFMEHGRVRSGLAMRGSRNQIRGSYNVLHDWNALSVAVPLSHFN